MISCFAISPKLGFSISTILVCVAVSSASPQAASHNHASEQTLPVIANGATNPNTIPDAAAYQNFVILAGYHRSPLPYESARRLYLLDQLRLTPADQRAFSSALDGVPEEIDNLQWSDDGPLADASSMQERLTQILDSAITRLKTSLSPGGEAKVATWVKNHVKQNSLIVGTARIP
jgi:hypothetical protein